MREKCAACFRTHETRKRQCSPRLFLQVACLASRPPWVLCPPKQIYFWEVTEEGQDAHQQRQQHQQHQLRKENHQQQQQQHKGGGGAEGRRRAVGWQPRGRLLAVVPKAHDGPITDISYLAHGEDGRQPAPAAAPRPARNPPDSSGGAGGEDGREWGRLATCGWEGTLRLWGKRKRETRGVGK